MKLFEGKNKTKTLWEICKKKIKIWDKSEEIHKSVIKPYKESPMRNPVKPCVWIVSGRRTRGRRC